MKGGARTDGSLLAVDNPVESDRVWLGVVNCHATLVEEGYRTTDPALERITRSAAKVVAKMIEVLKVALQP